MEVEVQDKKDLLAINDDKFQVISRLKHYHNIDVFNLDIERNNKVSSSFMEEEITENPKNIQPYMEDEEISFNKEERQSVKWNINSVEEEEEEIQSYKNELEQVKIELKQLKEKGQQLIERQKQINQMLEHSKRNYKEILSIGAAQQRKEVQEVLKFIKAKKVKIDKSNNFTKKRNVYNKSQKDKILNFQTYYSFTEISRLTGVTEQLLSKWRNKCTDTKIRKGKQVKSRELEEYLLQFLISQRNLKFKISVKRFQNEIVKKSEQLDIGIKGSRGFIQKFCKRNKVVIRKINSKIVKQISESEKNKFIYQFQQKLITYQYDPEQIINFDQTSISKDDTGDYTLAFQNEDHVRTKVSYEHKKLYTLGLSITSTGIKLKQHLIWPSKGVKKIFTQIPDNQNISYHEKGSYQDQAIFKQWVENILTPYAKKIPEGFKGILILDNFRGNTYPEFNKDLLDLNYQIMFLPPNSTSMLQPLDLKINQLYKQSYRQIREYQQTAENNQLSHQQFLLNLGKAWEDISNDFVRSSWAVFDQEVSQPQMQLEEEDEEEAAEDQKFTLYAQSDDDNDLNKENFQYQKNNNQYDNKVDGEDENDDQDYVGNDYYDDEEDYSYSTK